MTASVGSLIPHLKSAQVDINIQVSAQLNITPFVARRKVNVLLVTEVSTGLGSDSPELFVMDNRLCWRVPVSLALPHQGKMGQVGYIDVDAQTGEILADSTHLEEIGDHAQKLLDGSSLPAKP